MPREPLLRYRLGAAVTLAVTLTLTLSFGAPTRAEAAGPKVVLIVGPSGAVSDHYRSMANEVATVATAAGATVVKVYSPNATWAKVKEAVNGANIVIYLGHGNGFPNPYGTTELTDRHNGWGLNRTERSPKPGA